MDRFTVSLCVLVALAWSFPAASGQCRPLEAQACTIWLYGESAPRSSPVCAGEAWTPHLSFEQPKRFSDSNDDGWFESVLAFRFPEAAGCRCVSFRIHYAGDSTDWSMNIGNSATNNGFGGDAGTVPSLNYAEAHMSGSKLFLYSGGAPGDRRRDTLGPLARHDTDLELGLPALKGQVLEIEVCNQSFIFTIPGQDEPMLHGKVITPLHEHSLVINEESTIYAGFNRVISDTGGAPGGGRTGTGVERVEFFLSP